MHKISAFGFYQLKNAEHVSFFSNVQLAIDKAGVATLGIESELYANYVKAVAVEQDIVNRSQASVYTPEMEALDKERDRIFRLVRGKLQTTQYVSDNSPVKPFVTIIDKNLLTKYAADVTQAAYQEESALIAGFILDVNNFIGEDGIEACGIAEDLFELEEANKKFAEQYHDRVGEKAGTEDELTKNLRKATEELYNHLVLYVEYKANSDASTEVGKANITLIAHIDQLIADVRSRYNARTGRGGATSGSGSSEGGNVSPIPFPNK